MAENRQDNSNQLKQLAGSRPSSAARGVTMHWYDFLGPEPPIVDEDEKEVRLKSFKQRQNEERQKKLEEIKAQALAAQKFKEQKDHERRQRMEESRIREDIRRQQVEERKKAINDAERDRLESILKRNQERDARMEMKRRNERSSLVFAFGSSTPRMVVSDSSPSFWGHRRATSTQNITYTATPLTRRQSERELDCGSKKRATSAGGLERSAEATTPQHPAGCASGYLGRRRTDLMPTIPLKESSSPSSRKSFTRSPGRAYSMSRLDQLAKPRNRPIELPPLNETANGSHPYRPLSRPKQTSFSVSMSHLAVGKPGPAQIQKPLRKSDSRSMHQLSTTAPLPPPRTTRATELRQKKLSATTTSNHAEAPSRPSSSLSQQSNSSITSSVIMRSRTVATPRRPRPASIAITGISTDLKNGELKNVEKPPLPKTRKANTVGKVQEKVTKKKPVSSPNSETAATISSPTSIKNTIPSPVDSEDKQVLVKEDVSVQPQIEDNGNDLANIKDRVLDVEESKQDTLLVDLSTNDEQQTSQPVENIDIVIQNQSKETNSTIESMVEPLLILDTELIVKDLIDVDDIPPEKSDEQKFQNNDLEWEGTDMFSSASSKPRITTEEEAKAALAERRRVAREEAEKQALQEKLRIEEEARMELERQQREEEQQRVLIEQQRLAEEERLQEAIKEAQRREEEERIKREEEQRIKVLKEEAEKKAREEAEKQKAELQEKLKNEEKEREARRKRVEAIMLRTRSKNNAGSPQTDEKNAENKLEKVNGSKSETSENGHKNGKDFHTVDNIIPVESIKNANTVTANTISTDDTINSNDSWQRNSQTDLLM